MPDPSTLDEYIDSLPARARFPEITTAAQAQKVLVLWLLLSANPTITPEFVYQQWDEDIAPHVRDVPGAKEAAFIFYRDNSGPIGDATSTLQELPGNAGWQGPGVCKFTYGSILNMFPA